MKKKKPQTSKPKHEVEIDIFHSPSLLDKFMHAVDCFESGKRLAVFERMTVTGDPDLTKLCENIKNALEQVKRELLFIAINSIDGVRSKEPYAYIRPKIQTLSMYQNGNLGFGLFKDILGQLGHKAKTNETMEVTRVTV